MQLSRMAYIDTCFACMYMWKAPGSILSLRETDTDKQTHTFKKKKTQTHKETEKKNACPKVIVDILKGGANREPPDSLRR